MESSGIHISLKAETLGHFWGIPITNSLLMTWLVMGLLFIFVFLFRNSIKMIPGKLQAAIEWGLEGALAYMTETLEDAKLAKRFLPLIATLFLFILAINELEFFPGVGSIMYHTHEGFVPLLRASTADLNTTLALTLISVLTIEIVGILALGLFRYGGKFINFSSPVNFVVGLIELVSELGRLVSLSFRLFGNIFAGEVLIAVIALFVPYFVPVPFMLFEMFVGFVQAVIFALLTLFFIKLAVAPPHGVEAH
ncbi:ATP synthase F0 subunit A [Patescibacteria group bacterium]|nr:MAG: ATP synthase F0 subunit A [Patescibacteria group bacterium]